MAACASRYLCSQTRPTTNKVINSDIDVSSYDGGVTATNAHMPPEGVCPSCGYPMDQNGSCHLQDFQRQLEWPELEEASADLWYDSVTQDYWESLIAPAITSEDAEEESLIDDVPWVLVY